MQNISLIGIVVLEKKSFERFLPYMGMAAILNFERQRQLFCFGSLVILDVARCYLWLFTLYINIKIGKNSCKMLD